MGAADTSLERRQADMFQAGWDVVRVGVKKDLQDELAEGKKNLQDELATVQAEGKKNLQAELATVQAEGKKDLQAELETVQAEGRKNLQAELAKVQAEARKDLRDLRLLLGMSVFVAVALALMVGKK